jgi:hypothetical protein
MRRAGGAATADLAATARPAPRRFALTPDRAVQARASGEALHAAAAAVNAAGHDRTHFACLRPARWRRSARRPPQHAGRGGLLALLGSGLAGRLRASSTRQARRPAVLVLDIRPSGDVFVDGEPKGRAAAGALSLPPGRTRSRCATASFKPLQMDVTCSPARSWS